MPTKAKQREAWIASTVVRQAPVKYGDCQDCGDLIFVDETIWYVRDRLVCFCCGGKYAEQERGCIWWAGFTLPGLEEIVG